MARKVSNPNHPRPICPKPPIPIIANAPSSLPDLTGQSSLKYSDFTQTDAFIQSLSDWVGKGLVPSGSWVDPASQDYDNLRQKNKNRPAGQYTLNRHIQHLDGKEQTKRLQPLFWHDIRRAGHQPDLAFFAVWAAAEGYALPDLRALQYIRDNFEEAKGTTNPTLFSEIDLYKRYCGPASYYVHVLGSVVRCDDGDAIFLCLDHSDSDIDGTNLTNVPTGKDILLVIKDAS